MPSDLQLELENWAETGELDKTELHEVRPAGSLAVCVLVQPCLSNPTRARVDNNLGQVVYTHVPLSPSSITWYRPAGADALSLGR